MSGNSEENPREAIAFLGIFTVLGGVCGFHISSATISQLDEAVVTKGPLVSRLDWAGLFLSRGNPRGK